jgi:hypothetical protein
MHMFGKYRYYIDPICSVGWAKNPIASTQPRSQSYNCCIHNYNNSIAVGWSAFLQFVRTCFLFWKRARLPTSKKYVRLTSCSCAAVQLQVRGSNPACFLTGWSDSLARSCWRKKSLLTQSQGARCYNPYFRSFSPIFCQKMAVLLTKINVMIQPF